MKPETGIGKIVIKVPKGFPPGDYVVTVKNEVGSDTVEDGFHGRVIGTQIGRASCRERV